MITKEQIIEKVAELQDMINNFNIYKYSLNCQYIFGVHSRHLDDLLYDLNHIEPCFEDDEDYFLTTAASGIIHRYIDAVYGDQKATVYHYENSTFEDVYNAQNAEVHRLLCRYFRTITPPEINVKNIESLLEHALKIQFKKRLEYMTKRQKSNTSRTFQKYAILEREVKEEIDNIANGFMEYVMLELQQEKAKFQKEATR